jgi:hypothetical protein
VLFGVHDARQTPVVLLVSRLQSMFVPSSTGRFSKARKALFVYVHKPYACRVTNILLWLRYSCNLVSTFMPLTNVHKCQFLSSQTIFDIFFFSSPFHLLHPVLSTINNNNKELLDCYLSKGKPVVTLWCHVRRFGHCIGLRGARDKRSTIFCSLNVGVAMPSLQWFCFDDQS